jgi:hypothetical protein
MKENIVFVKGDVETKQEYADKIKLNWKFKNTCFYDENIHKIWHNIPLSSKVSTSVCKTCWMVCRW